MLIEFLAGAWIGYGWVAGRCRLALPVSLALLVVGAGLLLFRDQPPFGSFTQVIGATLGVLGALHPAFSAWKNRLLAAIGDSSYSLYLTHIFTLGALRSLWYSSPPISPT